MKALSDIEMASGMKASEVYLLAAERMARSPGFGSCNAIWGSSRVPALGKGQNWDGPYARPYRELFSPHGKKDQGGFWLEGHFETEDEKHQWRITALCLMSCIARDSERSKVKT